MKKHLFVIAAFCLATVACTSSVKSNKDNTLATAKEETVTQDKERAGALLSRKDSLALANLYKVYEKDVSDFCEKARTMEMNNEDYDRQLEKMKTDLETSLNGNPHFAPVVELRNLLLDYRTEMLKDEERKYDVDLNLEEDMPEEFVSHEKEMFFQDKWDEKLVKLLQDHPGFLECPPYMFEEALDMGVEVATSTDGRIRYYSYITGEWRRLVSVTCIRQYRTDNGRTMTSLVENKPTWGFVDEVHTLTVNGKNVYLLRRTHNEGCFYITYHAESIEGEKITHPVIFDTEENKGPYVLYNLDGPQKDWVAKYDEKTKTIYMRVTSKDDRYYLSNAYVTYTFDGKKFRLSGQRND